MNYKERLVLLNSLSNKDIYEKFIVPYYNRDGYTDSKLVFLGQGKEYDNVMLFAKEKSRVKVLLIKGGPSPDAIKDILLFSTNEYEEKWVAFCTSKLTDVQKSIIKDNTADYFEHERFIEFLSERVSDIFENEFFEIYQKYWEKKMQPLIESKRNVGVLSNEYIDILKGYELKAEGIISCDNTGNKENADSESDTDVYKSEIESLEALFKYKNLIIVGGAGMGKTTTLKRLAQKYHSENCFSKKLIQIPIYIDLSVSKNPSFEENFKKLLPQYEYFGNYLLKGNFVFLIDGLEDIKEQDQAISSLNEFRNMYSMNQIVIATRDKNLVNKLGDFAVVEINNSVNYVKEYFIQQRLKSVPIGNLDSMKIANFVTKILRDQDFWDRATPLILDHICSFIANIPLQLGDIQQDEEVMRFIETRLCFRNESEIFQSSLASGNSNVLEQIAYSAHSKHLRRFSKKDILQWCEMQKEEDSIRFQGMFEDGISRYICQEGDQFTFKFLTYQELFAAKYLSRKTNDIEEILQNIYNPWWERVIVLYASMNREKAISLVKKITALEKENTAIATNKEDIFFTNYKIKAMCLIDHSETEMGECFYVELYETYRKYSSFQPTKEKIEEIFTYCRPRAIVKALIDELSPENAGTIKQANIAPILAKIKSEYACTELVRVYKGQLNVEIKKGIIRALAEIGIERAVPFLKSILIGYLNEKNCTEGEACEAAKALGQIGGKEAEETLIKVFQSDLLDNIRKAVIEGLSSIGDEECVMVMQKHLENENSGPVKEILIEKLGLNLSNMGTYNKIKKLYDEYPNLRTTILKRLHIADVTHIPQVYDILNQALYDSKTQEEAIKIIGRYKIKDFVPRLLAIYAIDRNKKSLIVETLGYIEGEELVRWFLINVLKNNEEIDVVRGKAAEALVRVKCEKEEVELLKSILSKDVPAMLSAVIIGALGIAKAEGIVDDLVKYINTGHKIIDEKVAEALGNYNDNKVALEALKSLLLSDDYGILYRAIQSIGKIGNSQAVDSLNELLIERTLVSEHKKLIYNVLDKINLQSKTLHPKLCLDNNHILELLMGRNKYSII